MVSYTALTRSDYKDGDIFKENMRGEEKSGNKTKSRVDKITLLVVFAFGELNLRLLRLVDFDS